jgi:hypothetical protein
MMRNVRLLVMRSLVIALMGALAGCQIGPRAMRMGHSEYAASLNSISKQQLLLNLVRLRYRDTPVWLEVTSISTQFEFGSSGDLKGGLNENVGQGGALNPNKLELGAGVRYSERPTITYSILRGDQFTKRMLAPITVSSISLLAESGWRSDRVLQLTVERMNGMMNAPRASSPTPTDTPVYRDFLEAVGLMRELARERHIDFVYETRYKPVSEPTAVEKVSPGDLINAAKANSVFRTNPESDQVFLAAPERVVVLRFREKDADLERVDRLRELLGLEEGLLRADLVEDEESDFNPFDPQRQVKTVGLDTRSFMGVLYYLSNGVAVPPEDQAAGPVSLTVDDEGHPFDWQELLQGLFAVHYSSQRPVDAAVAVRYRGKWFYIADDDDESQSTFALLDQLADLVAGDVQQTAPVLTLPIGGG